MILNQSDSLEVVTGTAADVDVLVTYEDEGNNPALPKSEATAIDDDDTHEVLAGPSSGTVRHVREINIRNKDASTTAVTVQLNPGASGEPTVELHKATLLTEGQITWTPASGWTTTQASTTLGVINTVILEDDVANSGDNALANVTGLSFAVTADQTYWFRFVIDYTAAAATTGSRWTINGPTSPTRLSYRSQYTVSATAVTTNQLAEYDKPDAANADSVAAGSLAVIEGFITPSASGTVIARFASEVNTSAITAKAGSLLEWKRVA